MPLANITAAKKRQHVETVLSWLPDAPPVPADMEEGMRAGGSFNGGQGFNQQLWLQVLWLARFTILWGNLSDAARIQAHEDPWAFRPLAAGVAHDLPAMRNAFLFMAFPAIFESIVNDDHKVHIRDAFALVIGGATGATGEAIDRDLLAIRAKLDAESHERVDWYVEPWVSQWKKSKEVGDRAWAVRTKPAGIELVDQWLAEGFVSLAATHLGDLAPGADRAEVRERISSGYDHLDYAQRMYLTDEYFAFLSRMKEGDIVATRHDNQVWVGRISSQATYSADLPRLRRSVDWRTAPFDLSELPAPVPALLGSSRSVIDLTEAREVLEKLIADSTEALPVETKVEPTPSLDVTPALRRASPEFAASLHLDAGWLNEFLGDRKSTRLNSSHWE